MKKYLTISIYIISIVFMFSSCIEGTSSQAPSSPVAPTDTSENSGTVTIQDIKNPQAIEDTKYYKLLQGDGNNYYYYIYDDKKEIVDEGGFYWRSPTLSMVNDDIVKFRIQMGTGISTSSTFYYNAKKDVLSRTFHSVYDETNELLVFSEYGKLIVRNIFDKTAYYREFTEFDNISDIVQPFVNAEFVNDNTQLEITYLKGEDFVEVTEILDLY